MTHLGRYEDLGPLGEGAMGEVRRVRDPVLGRVMAMKILRAELLPSPALRARFLAEARATACLQHPGIVPVHELGELADGRLYFTMKEVRGQTFGEAIEELHGRGPRRSVGDPPAWTLRRVLDAFHRVCEAVAYAHASGFIHRDLKPENVMLGPFGEALVLDWGLAAAHGEATGAKVAGTPAYMAPEQARGDGPLGPPADVYALGAVLYQILSGEPPYAGDDVLARVIAGPPPPPRIPVAAEPAVADLAATCRVAMARDPGLRYAHAGELAAEIAAWLEGARRREQALQNVRRAEGALPEVAALRKRAARLREDARVLLEGVRGWEPVDRKRPAWEAEDEARALEDQAEVWEVEVVQLLRAALADVPDLAEARALLSAYWRRKQEEAEARRDPAAVRYEALLRASDTGENTRWLSGEGALTLHTDPPGATVELYAWEIHDRRLVPVHVRTLGRTPLDAVELPMGSWLLRVRAPGRAAVRYPVRIGREEHWDGVPPGASAPLPIALPPEDALGPEDLYVPAGWTRVGGDPATRAGLDAARVWVDGFVMRRFHVTNAEYVALLDALVAEGREPDALALVPRDRPGRSGATGVPLYGRDARGRFVLARDADGDVWQPHWPVMFVSWPMACAYAAEIARRTRLPWRLPGEIEWEKAARGVDGRHFPFGDFCDPTWCCIGESHAGRPLPPDRDAYPDDVGPYGVRDLAGNALDWTADAFERRRPELDGGVARGVAGAADAARVVRGGSFGSSPGRARSAERTYALPDYRAAGLSFRLTRSWPA